MNTTQEPEYVDIDEHIVTASGERTELLAPKKFEGMSFLSPSNLPDLSDDNVDVGVSIAPKYYEFLAAGEIVRAVYNGMTVITSNKNGQRREIDTVVFQNKDGVFLNSGANLVQQLRGFPVGNPIQITYLGKEKTNSGNEVKRFEVRVLSVKAG